MKTRIYSKALLALSLLGLTACSQDSGDIRPADGQYPMRFNFSMPGQTKATETAFENGDKVGMYVCETLKPLEIGGNTVNNELITFNGSAWTSSKNLYWDDGNFNAFAYYPYNSDVNSIKDYPFEVKLDQNAPATESSLSGFEASDFLFSSAKNIVASNNPLDMKFRHIMSRVTIRLIKGEDFEGDLPETAVVYIHNTVTSATIDLSAGVATPLSRGLRKTVRARREAADTYTAIMVPQRLDNRVPLIEVIMNGVSYLYESKFQFKPGVHHLVNLTVDKNPEQIKIEIGGEIVNWN